MESTGPMTRSRAKSGAAVDTSAAPSTRKRAATRSTRKSAAAAAKNLLVAEPDDTATRTDVAECAEEQQPSSTSFDQSLMDHEVLEMPATVLAGPQAESSTTGTAAIAGLTPVSTMMTPGLPTATPCIMGPSPIQPIQLESLLSPEMPPASAADSRPFSAGGATVGLSPSEVGTDLAAMFISTPAVAGDAASPVEGLVSDAPGGAPANPEQQAFAEQPFGGFAEEAVAAEPEADMQEPTLQQTDADDLEPVGFGSPAPVAAVDDGVVTELEEAAPSAPLSPKPASSPAPAAASSAAPTGSCRALCGSTRSPAPIAAAFAAASPMPMPSPGLDEDDDDLPPADEEYPEEALLRQEAKAAGLLPPSPAPAACTMGADYKQHEAEPAVEDDTECLSAVVQEGSKSAADAEMATEEYSEELLLPLTEDDEELLSDAEEAQLTEMQAELDAQAAAMAVQQEADEQAAAEDEHEADAMECADEGTAAADEDITAAAPTEAEDDMAMLYSENPAAEVPAGITCPTPDVKTTPAAADLSVISPEVVAAPVVTSPSRTAGAATTTTAPPKSAIAKPKMAGAPSARKSAHVVVTGPSPKSAQKSAAGSSSQCSTGSVDDSSSPGHTPYPSKAKVKAATAAANRGSMAAAAQGAGISHKKDIALACADSALKKYAKSLTAEQQHSSNTGGSSMKGSSPSVGSRLLQPTASFMAKARASATPEADPYVWSPPEAETSSAAAPAAPKPRLASKVVVPSPPPAHAAAEPSLKSLKRTIKEKTAAKAAAKAEATVAEHRSRSAADKVHDVQQMRGSKPKVQALPAEEAELDFDEDDYEDQAYDQDADALADSLAGMRVGQLRVGRPAGPLKGVAAPAGKHLVFDEQGKAKETPASKLRQAPRHTYFDDEGRAVEAPAARPVWR